MQRSLRTRDCRDKHMKGEMKKVLISTIGRSFELTRQNENGVHSVPDKLLSMTLKDQACCVQWHSGGASQ